MPGSVGSWLIVVGIVLVVIGLAAKSGILGWFGHLPGDVQIKRDNVQFYFPLTSMIIASVVLSLLLALIRRFF